MIVDPKKERTSQTRDFWTHHTRILDELQTYDTGNKKTLKKKNEKTIPGICLNLSACTTDLWSDNGYVTLQYTALYYFKNCFQLFVFSIGTYCCCTKVKQKVTYSYHYLHSNCHDYCAFQLHLSNVGKWASFQFCKKENNGLERVLRTK